MKQKTTAPSALSAEDRFSRRVAAYLDASAQALPHDISERLRVARQQALCRHHEILALEARTLPMGGGVAALGGGEGSWWPRLASFLPLLALIAGLITIQIMGTDQTVKDLAEIDAAILTDDLPPDAYADPGFAQFLKTRLHQLQQD